MPNKLLPGATIGIIGGGQLAYYMALEALNMGFIVKVYDPNPLASAGRVAELFCHDFDDLEMLRAFAERCDVLTYEFENMNLEHIEILDQEFNLPQGAKMLRHTAHRYHEIQMAQALKIPVVKSVYLEKSDSDQSALATLALPLISKSCRFGYDGKHQKKITDLSEVQIETESLVSEFIQFDCEISIVLVRGQHGVSSFPCFENVHHEGILHTSKTLAKDLYPQAHEYALRIVEAMDYIGVMAVEFFVKDNKLIFNEVAPRPHNSGHLTLTVSNKSQFRVHIEALCGYEIGELYHYEDATMLNLLGQDLLKARTLIGRPHTYHYEYGKEAIRTNRKMGHVVFIKGSHEISKYKGELTHE